MSLFPYIYHGRAEFVPFKMNASSITGSACISRLQQDGEYGEHTTLPFPHVPLKLPNGNLIINSMILD